MRTRGRTVHRSASRAADRAGPRPIRSRTAPRREPPRHGTALVSGRARTIDRPCPSTRRPGSATPSSTRSFPDRFAPATASQARAAGAVGRPPTNYGFKGGDLLGVVEHLDHLVDLGRQRAVPERRSSSRPRTTATTRTTTSRSTRCWAATRRCASCSTRRTRAACGSSSTACSTTPAAASGRSTTSLETGVRLAVPALVPLRRGGPRARAAARRVPGARASRRRRRQPGARHDGRRGAESLRAPRLRAWWDLPALPKLNIDEPAGPRVPAGRRRALAPLRHRRLAPGRRRARSTTGFWREFRRRVPGDQPGGVPRRRDLAASRRTGSRGDRFDALMNYPLAEAILGFVGRRSARTSRWSAPHHEYRRPSRPLDGAGVRRPAGASCWALYDPAVTAVQLNLLDSHDTPRFLSMRRRRRGVAAARDAAPDDAARRAVHLLRRRGRARGRPRPGLPPRVPVGRVALGPRAPRRRPDGSSRFAMPSRCCATARSASSMPTTARWPSSGSTRTAGWPSG